MQLLRNLIQSLDKGFSLRHIARELKISRKTVTLYATRLHASGHTFTALRQLDDALLANLVYTPVSAIAAHLSEDLRKQDFLSRMDYFISELKRPGVTRLLLWQEV